MRFNNILHNLLFPLWHLMKEWSEQHACELLVGPLERDSHTISDVFRFIVTLKGRRKEFKRNVSTPLALFVDTWRRLLILWLSNLLDAVVLTTTLNDQSCIDRPPVAQSYHRPGKRKYTVVSAEAKWFALSEARRVRANTSLVLSLNQDSPQLGCNDQAFELWTMKEQTLYGRRCGTCCEAPQRSGLNV